MNRNNNTFYQIETCTTSINDLCFGNESTIEIDMQADIINCMYLKIDLPELEVTEGNVAWVKNLGQMIIKNIKLIVMTKSDENYITFYGACADEKDYNNYSGYNVMTGNIEELTSFSRTKNSYTLYIPLRFWDSNSYPFQTSMECFPLFPMDLKYFNKIELIVELNNLENLIIKTSNADVLNPVITGSILFTCVYNRIPGSLTKRAI